MIDELERIRRFRSEEPPPSETARREASAKLAQAMGRSRAHPPPSARRTTKQHGPARRRWLPRAPAIGAAVTACVAVIELVGSGPDTVYLTSRIVARLPHQPPIPLSPPCVNGGGYVTNAAQGGVQTGHNPNR